MKLRRLLLPAAVTCALLASGCERKPNVIIVNEDEVKEAESPPPGRSEEELRAEYEARIKARENQPEPELDPNDPREKFELVWKVGQSRIDSIYSERAEMLGLLSRIKLDDPKEKATVEPLVKKLTEFGIGREPASMEKAAAELCKVIEEVRGPAEALIGAGETELKRINDETAALDAKAESGGTVYQRQWDKIDKERTRWSAPVKAGKQMLLVIKSILEEGYVLADLGPRRAQIALRDCLGPMVDKPFTLDLTQDQLVKTVGRAKWYRDLP